MSSHRYKPIHGSLHNNLVILDGYVSLGTDGYVLSSGNTLNGVTVTHSGAVAGEYTFTLDDPRGSIVYAAASVLAPTAVSLVAQVKSISASAVVMNLLAGATKTNPAASTGLLVSIHYKRSNGRVKG